MSSTNPSVGHSQALTWRSEQAKVAAEFRSVVVGLRRKRFDRSPFVPTTLRDFVALKAWIAEKRAAQHAARLEGWRSDIALAEKQNRPPFIEFKFQTGAYIWERSRAMALETVWSPFWTETEEHPLCPWPTLEEFKEEGDERHTSCFGRYLPIPRVPGNPTVSWKQKPFVTFFEMDRVHPVPRRFQIEFPNDFEPIEPIEDDSGAIIDDPNDPGTEVSVEEGGNQTPWNMRSATAFSRLSGAQQRQFLPTGAGANAGRWPNSRLNPATPEFVSQYAAQSRSTSSSGFTPPIPSFSARQLPSLSSIFGRDQGSTERSLITTQRDARGADNFEPEITLALPDWMIEEEEREAEAAADAESSLEQTQQTEAELREEAQQDVFTAYHLPTFGSNNPDPRSIAFPPLDALQHKEIPAGVQESLRAAFGTSSQPQISRTRAGPSRSLETTSENRSFGFLTDAQALAQMRERSATSPVGPEAIRALQQRPMGTSPFLAQIQTQMPTHSPWRGPGQVQRPQQQSQQEELTESPISLSSIRFESTPDFGHRTTQAPIGSGRVSFSGASRQEPLSPTPLRQRTDSSLLDNVDAAPGEPLDPLGFRFGNMQM